MREEHAAALVGAIVLFLAAVVIILFTEVALRCLDRVCDRIQKVISLPTIYWPIALTMGAFLGGTLVSAIIRACWCRAPLKVVSFSDDLIDSCNVLDHVAQKVALVGITPYVFVFAVAPRILGRDIFVPICRHVVAALNWSFEHLSSIAGHFQERAAALAKAALRTLPQN